MDDLARYNQERWEELAQADVQFARPFLDLDQRRAREFLDAEGIMGAVSGLDVLCLAAGGGQQSVTFALLGAEVTVLDLADTQLVKDREAAAHYGYPVTTVQGDMRHLSRFDEQSFDLVYQAYSINFVPDVRPVFRGVARVLRTDGLYRLECANPFTQTVDMEAWNGEAYPLTHPYIDGFDISTLYPHWDVENTDGGMRRIKSPKEFRHTLSTLINCLIESGFSLSHMQEIKNRIENPTPGSREHFKSVAPPYFLFWSRLR